LTAASQPATVLPDARPTSLVLRLTPDVALPFVQLARLDRPAGWQLLLAPCWESTALAGLALHRGPNLWHLVLFLIGAVAMRGAGCTYNDILDRKLDAGVERTRNRPLPSGRVTIRAAVAFLVVQALMKRVTSWPQATLGLAFSWGALMGWSATFASLALPPILLYASAFAWTIGYDTVYALQDARDDAIVGIRSTARLFGSHVKFGIGAFYVVCAALALAAIETAGGGAIALIGWLAFCVHLAWQASQVEGADAPTALRLFRSNRDAGLILFAGVALQGWLG
jgi:4-hydroxybenzoate polyprenyltransferase